MFYRRRTRATVVNSVNMAYAYVLLGMACRAFVPIGRGSHPRQRPLCSRPLRQGNCSLPQQYDVRHQGRLLDVIWLHIQPRIYHRHRHRKRPGSLGLVHVYCHSQRSVSVPCPTFALLRMTALPSLLARAYTYHMQGRRHATLAVYAWQQQLGTVHRLRHTVPCVRN